MSNKTASTAQEAIELFPEVSYWYSEYLKHNTVTSETQDTAPPKREWVGLTDDLIEDEWEKYTGHSIIGGDRTDGRQMFISPDEVLDFAKALDAKLKESNA